MHEQLKLELQEIDLLRREQRAVIGNVVIKSSDESLGLKMLECLRPMLVRPEKQSRRLKAIGSNLTVDRVESLLKEVGR